MTLGRTMLIVNWNRIILAAAVLFCLQSLAYRVPYAIVFWSSFVPVGLIAGWRKRCAFTQAVWAVGLALPAHLAFEAYVLRDPSILPPDEREAFAVLLLLAFLTVSTGIWSMVVSLIDGQRRPKVWAAFVRWVKHDWCPRCGYDLTGNTSGVCPECGTEAGPK